jgi:hypothetical protein
MTTQQLVCGQIRKCVYIEGIANKIAIFKKVNHQRNCMKAS